MKVWVVKHDATGNVMAIFDSEKGATDFLALLLCKGHVDCWLVAGSDGWLTEKPAGAA